MSRLVIRLAATAGAALLALACTACAVMPSGQAPIAQDTHDFVGGEN